ncbi:MAG TPA: hypothetical protein VJH96_02975 [Patescibacteria group bacterium]|nr:hypothetical protein [Patescibacteria group bacterium]
MDQQQSSLPPGTVDKRIKQLTKAIEHVYGSSFGIAWRNFLAGFMKAFGGLIAYVLFIVVLFFVIQKTGVIKNIQTTWQNFTKNFVGEIQKNITTPKIDTNFIQQLQPDLDETTPPPKSSP